jgi:spore germination cell wall hydrolase CwlJ-like protein
MIVAAATCLALVMYREARGESIATQIATARILQNRAAKRKTSECKELKRKNQFSWTSKYKVEPPHPVGSKDRAAWRLSQRLSKSLENLKVIGVKPSMVYFNTVSMGKRFKTKNKPRRIGKMIFY